MSRANLLNDFYFNKSWRVEEALLPQEATKNEAFFFFWALKIHGAGHYLCLDYDVSYRGSLFSDILKIWVTSKRWRCYETYVIG